MPVTLGNIAFQAISLIVSGAFCWMIYTFRAQAAECFKGVFKFSSRDATGVENKRLYDNFLGVAMTLGAFSAALGIVKVTAAMLASGTGTPGTIQWRLAGLAGTDGIAGMPSWVVPTAVVAVAVVTALVVLAEMGALKAAGAITLSTKFADAIIRMKRNWLALLSLMLTPLVAVWTGVNPERDTIVAYLFVVVAIILCGLFVAHTLRGFIKQKVSLLVWFLYLCTVEIFPVCAIVVAATKFV
jgi:hypothetical protein